MAYSELADIKNQLDESELVQLTDDEGIGLVNESRVTRAIADADEEIDGYLQSRMVVPVSPVPGIIRKCSVDIALWNLFARRGDSMPETRKERYKNAVAFLVKVAEGKIGLGANDPDGNPPETSGVSYSGSDQVMTSDKLERF